MYEEIQETHNSQKQSYKRIKLEDTSWFQNLLQSYSKTVILA